MSIWTPALLSEASFEHFQSFLTIICGQCIKIPKMIKQKFESLDIKQIIINYQYLWRAITYQAAYLSASNSSCLKSLSFNLFLLFLEIAEAAGITVVMRDLIFIDVGNVEVNIKVFKDILSACKSMLRHTH